MADDERREEVQEEARDEALADEETTDQQMNRRRFLSGAFTGGAAGLAVAAGTGLAAWRITDSAKEAQLSAAQSEIARLQGLLKLYETLDGVGLDAVVQAGMKAVAGLLEPLELGAKALKAGVEAVRTGLAAFEKTFPAIQAGIGWVEGRISALADGLQRLQDALGKAVSKASPLTDALGEFARFVLTKLPFGIGDKVQAVLDRVSDLVSSIPDLITGINTNLLDPLKSWFSPEKGKGLDDILIDPLVNRVLDPLDIHLGELASLIDTWQKSLVAPGQKAIDERASIRASIDQYKKQNGLGEGSG